LEGGIKIREIIIRTDGRTVSLEEGDTILSLATADPEEAQAIYNEIAGKVRRLVAGIL